MTPPWRCVPADCPTLTSTAPSVCLLLDWVCGSVLLSPSARHAACEPPLDERRDYDEDLTSQAMWRQPDRPLRSFMIPRQPPWRVSLWIWTYLCWRSVILCTETFAALIYMKRGTSNRVVDVCDFGLTRQTEIERWSLDGDSGYKVLFVYVCWHTELFCCFLSLTAPSHQFVVLPCSHHLVWVQDTSTPQNTTFFFFLASSAGVVLIPRVPVRSIKQDF